MSLETLSIEALVRMSAHESLRLFEGSLVGEDERQWTADPTKKTALRYIVKKMK